MTPQLDIQLSLKNFQLKHQPWEVMHGDSTRPNIYHHKMGPMVTQGFTVAKLAILTEGIYIVKMRICRVFLIAANHSYDQKS